MMSSLERLLEEHVTGRNLLIEEVIESGALQDWRGKPISTLANRADLSEIARLAEELTNRLSALDVAAKEELGGLLAVHRGHGAMLNSIGRPRAQWFPDDCPPELAPYLTIVRRIREEASSMAPAPPKRGAPPRMRGLVQGLALYSASTLYAGAAWTDEELALPSGPFCRLVKICHEALGHPQPSNVGQMVRRALAHLDASEAENEVEYSAWQIHAEQNCDPESCQFCSP